jgi:hypothetical protein
MSNYFQTWVTFSTVLPNWGSWSTSIPGWVSPNGNRLAAPLLLSAPVYLYWGIAGILVACWVMRKAKSRWPQLGPVGLMCICFGVAYAFDVLAEGVWLRTGYYSYPGAIPGLTLFHGHYYQLPLYPPAFAAAMVTCWAWLRYRIDDNGRTFVERGVDETGLKGKKRTVVRFLAICGYLNLIYLIVFDIPIGILGIHAAAWPKDIVDRSYLTSQLCGPETTYACSAPNVPIPRRNSAHLGPDGTLIVPRVGAKS